MKKLLVVLAVLGVSSLLVGCGNKEITTTPSSNEMASNTSHVEETLPSNNTGSENEEIVNVPKSEQIGTAGSNIPIKDNQSEAEYQIKVAFQKWLEDTFKDDVVDARIYVAKVYTAEEEQENESLKGYHLGPDEVAFEVKYELKPAEGVDVNSLTAATGEYDEETGWIKEKYNLGILRPNASGEGSYVVTDVGTGW